MEYTSGILSEVTTWCHTITPVKYGALYNWYAATDARLICSAGWHIPTSTEISTLQTYCGGDAVAGTKLRESGNTYWQNGVGFINGTNDYGFNLRGAGGRDTSGTFAGLLDTGYIRASNSTYYAYTTYVVNNFYLFNGCPEVYGLSIRPLKDSTTLTHGQAGTYIGNDGKVYRTICIGNQEWVADNIAETEYRNGDTILNITDNAVWAALITGAMCYYNNDISYM